MFDQPVDSLGIDAARHEAVVALVRRVPANEFANLLRMAHAQERSAHHGAVADPRPRIATRSRLQRRTCTRDQYVRRCRERGMDRIRHPAGARPLFRANPLAPIERKLACRPPGAERRAVHHALAGLPAVDRQVEAQGARGETEWIASLRVRGQRTRGKVGGDEPFIERHRSERDLSAQGRDRQSLVHPYRAIAPDQVPNPADAAQVPEALPGRRDLEGPHQNEQAGPNRLTRQIFEAVSQPGRTAHRRLGGHSQPPILSFPQHAGHGHPTVLELLPRRHIGPRNETAAEPQHGLE